MHPLFLFGIKSIDHEKVSTFKRRAYSFVRKILEPQNSRQQHKPPNSFTTLFIRVLLKFVFILEPLIPFFATYYLNRQFNTWKKMNLISNHKVRIKRMGRFYYSVDLHLVITAEQVGNIIIEAAKNILNRLESRNRRLAR